MMMPNGDRSITNSPCFRYELWLCELHGDQVQVGSASDYNNFHAFIDSSRREYKTLSKTGRDIADFLCCEFREVTMREEKVVKVTWIEESE
jgi:hypothetical protein